MTVSVLMVTYNHQEYVQKAIQSVLAQDTDFPFELLVGDDGSTDRTPERILEAAEDPRVVPVLRKKNIGAANNLLDLQKHAKGEYIAYLDGDDYWCDPRKLQTQVDFLRSRPEYAACTHACLLVDAEGKACARQHLTWISEKEIFTIQDFRGLILPGHLSTLMHRSGVLRGDPAFETLMTAHPVIADRSLFLYLLSKGSAARLPQTMSCYRQAARDGNNATTSVYKNNPDWVRDDYEYTKRLERYAEDLLGVDAGFRYRRRSLFASAVGNFARRPSKRGAGLVVEILKDGPALDCLLHFPAEVFWKLIQKL